MESGKTPWVNFKNAVWHASFLLPLQSMIKEQEIGRRFICGDGIERWIFLILLILSADYEEQFVFFLYLWYPLADMCT